MKNKKIIYTILINYFPFLFMVGFVTLALTQGLTKTNWWIYPSYLYFIPPFLCRFISLFFKKKSNFYTDEDKFYFYWWFTVQLQVVFVRFPFFEELLRMVPMLYSNWLKLWGAKIGKNIYWSAGVTIMDRPFLKVGDAVVFGYGSAISSHYAKNRKGRVELVLADIIIEDRAMLGGMSGMTTGARLCEGQLLPGKTTLLPFQEISKGKKAFREDISRKSETEFQTEAH